MQIIALANTKGGICMDEWDRFFESGKICDYINYARSKRGKGNADSEMPCTERKKRWGNK